MFHRKAAPFVVTTTTAAATATAASSSSSTTAQLPPRRRRRVSTATSSSSSIFTTKLTRTDFMTAMVATFVVTALIVAMIWKLYFYAFVTHHDTDSHSIMSNNSNNKNHPHFFHPFALTKKQKPPSPNHHQQQQQQQQQHKDTGSSSSSDTNTNTDDDAALPYNELYRIPNSMKNVGDRSDRYIQLRMDIDALLPVQQYDRSLQFVQQLLAHNPFVPHVSGNIQPAPQVVEFEEEEEQAEAEAEEGDNNGIQEPRVMSQQQQQQQHNSDQIATNPTYDIYHCPDTPPEGYPYTWNMIQILNNWKPDNTTRPSSNRLHQSLCVFDYNTDYDKAMTYRNAELPFLVLHDPAVAETVERWNTPGYLPRLMGSALHRTEYSPNNHFMYFVPPPKNKRLRQKRQMNHIVPPDWTAPTKLIRMSYMEWLEHANVTDDTLLGPDHPHWYYRLIGCGMTGNDGSCDTESSEYLFDELTFFQPRPNQLYIVDPDEQKGIHCRFGMKGVIAENHFDGSRNAIVVLGGSRRYILAHPNQCEHLALYPKGHPSARHSAVDWGRPNLQEYPQFAQARGNEVVLTAGQVLYLPTEWFHFIVSLELNFQCNTRSGITNHYKKYIKQCGF